jgi:transcriptional regulator with XRE-family HTH domain
MKKINRSQFAKAKVHVHVSPGEMVKKLRELHGMTQKQLSDATGITQSNLSALESGSRQLGRERALTLAKALKVHPAVILFPDFDVNEVA